ncbi:MAG TPA: hypothetical protein DCE33_00315 [Rhodospirillaceae bacterium]|nr:hypothetical protein [Rhodospirillaceae bacterium]
MIENPKFKTTADRQANREELEAIVVDILAEKTAAEWGEFLRDADIPSGPVLDIGEALRQPSVAARGLIKETDHPAAGKVEVVGSPIQYKGAFEDEAYAPSAILGQHTETVLSDLLGYDKEQLERLKNNGVIE